MAPADSCADLGRCRPLKDDPAIEPSQTFGIDQAGRGLERGGFVVAPSNLGGSLTAPRSSGKRADGWAMAARVRASESSPAVRTFRRLGPRVPLSWRTLWV